MYGYIQHLIAFCHANNVAYNNIVYKCGSDQNSALYLMPTNPRSKTLLVCHGLGADRFYPFTELFVKLLSAGYSIFSIDLNGHGKDNRHFFAYPDVRDTLPAAITCLNGWNVREQDIVLFGHSLGGIYCFMEGSKNRCGGIITVSAPYYIDIKWSAALELVLLINTHIIRQFKYYSLYELIPAFYRFKRDAFPCRCQPPTKWHITAVRDILTQLNVLDNFHNCKIPYLQIHGRMDYAVPFKQALQIHKCHNGPKELFSLKYASHFTSIFQTKNVTKIVRWLDALDT